jgi:hypothetical protein
MKKRPAWGGEPKTSPDSSGYKPQRLPLQRLSASMVSVYDGRRCIGFVLAAGRDGYRAYDADEIALGSFPNMKDAAAAVSARAIGGAV